MGLLTLPISKRCPTKWQWPVSSPVTCPIWALPSRSIYNSPGSPLHGCPEVYRQCFWWSLTAQCATLAEMPQACSALVNVCTQPILGSWPAASLPSTLYVPAITWDGLRCVHPVQGSTAIPDQFRIDFTVVQCFNCSLTVWENVFLLR
jgi:hypothetical protein